MDSSQFVTITDVVPDVILEIRYYGTYNFVGSRIDGYEEPTALLTRLAADSLKKVSDDVMRQGYRLKIYDAYRPQKGVDHFVRWVQDLEDMMKPYFYPNLDKNEGVPSNLPDGEAYEIHPRLHLLESGIMLGIMLTPVKSIYYFCEFQNKCLPFAAKWSAMVVEYEKDYLEKLYNDGCCKNKKYHHFTPLIFDLSST